MIGPDHFTRPINHRISGCRARTGGFLNQAFITSLLAAPRSDGGCFEATCTCGKMLVCKRDLLFSSSSAAAATLRGGVQNGRTVWKTKDGRTLKQLEEALLESP